MKHGNQRSLLILSLALLILGAGCAKSPKTISSINGSISVTPAGTNNPIIVQTNASDPITIGPRAEFIVKNNQLLPTTVTIVAGQSIRWTNEGSAPFRFLVEGLKQPIFFPKELVAGDSFTITFDRPGSYAVRDIETQAIVASVEVT